MTSIVRRIIPKNLVSAMAYIPLNFTASVFMMRPKGFQITTFLDVTGMGPKL